MDVKPPHHQPATSDNDELAKVLAGIGGDDGTQHKKSAVEAAGLQFEETPVAGAPQDTPAPATDPVQQGAAATEPAMTVQMPEPVAAPSYGVPSQTSSGLEDLKKAALEELRPLVTKLELPAEEKFDTLLLIIRSTDDKSLLEPAHEAAKLIADEAKRAQALLDIIKEIDYFGAQPK